jgi:Ca2+-binding RTX toxin-like protein
LLGSSSSDIFTGNGSAILMGRGGNDIYHVKTKDSVRETAGGGRDTVYAKASYALRSDAEVEVLTLSGVLSSRSANLTGSNTANAITGHGGRNSLKGQGGHDTLKASSGNDTLSGGTGNDTLQGGTGRDTLKGGSGRDAFVFDTRPSSTHVDRIVDFRSADDSLFLDNAVFAGLGRGSSGGVRFKADMFVEGTGAKDAQDRIVYDRATGSLYHDQDGTGAKAQVKIATLANKAPLSHLDFFVI